MITSSSNQQIKNLMQLQKKAKARKEKHCFVVEGIKMYEEIPEERFVKAYISESLYMDITTKNKGYFDGKDIEVVKDNIFKEASDTMCPQGIMAIVGQDQYKLDELIGHKGANLIILEDLRDPGNLGTILRTSEGAGITGVLLSTSCVDIYNPKVIRSTMGSIYRVPFVYVDDLGESIRRMKEHNIVLYAAHLNGKKDYDKEKYMSKCGILIGNEANGLSDEISQMADFLIKIPMCGKVESLNAAVASSILMYEVFRQKRE